MFRLLSIFIVSLFLAFPLALAQKPYSEDNSNPKKNDSKEKQDRKIITKDDENPKKSNQLSTETEKVSPQLYRQNDRVLENKKSDSLEKNKSNPSCQNSLNMMQKRIQVMDENLKKRRALVVKTTEILNKKIAELDSKNIDTSSVKLSLAEYINKTNDLLNQREGSIMVLADLTRFDCEGDPSNFKNNLKDFNQRFRNQNLEFNRLNREFRNKVLYELSSLIEKSNLESSELEEGDSENKNE